MFNFQKRRLFTCHVITIDIVSLRPFNLSLIDYRFSLFIHLFIYLFIYLFIVQIDQTSPCDPPNENNLACGPRHMKGCPPPDVENNPTTIELMGMKSTLETNF